MIHSFQAAARALRRASPLPGALATACAVLFGLPAGAQTASTVAGSAESEVVATLGSKQVTQSELEAYVAPQLMTLRQQRQDVLEKGLDRFLSQQVLEREAKAQGLSLNELIKREVTDKIVVPTDKEVDAFYEANKNRIDAPKEQIAQKIKQYLTQQREQQAFAGYADSLKAKYGVKVLLKPLRVAVDLKGEPSIGPADAAVTLVEFGDFECPYCAGLEKTLKQVRKNYGERVRLVFRQFPLRDVHPDAFKAAEASLCAHEQGKFWELHDTMYGNQKALSANDLKAAAAKLGMDANKFNRCLDSGKFDDAIQADLQAGEKAGVTGTPALFVNGRPVPGGAVPYGTLAKVIDDELARGSAAGAD